MGRVLASGGAVVAAACILAACGGAVAATSGRVVNGQLIRVGGPAPGLPVPLPGQIEARDGSGHHYAAPVGRDGWFRLHLPPGRYLVTGHSPRIQDGKELCSAAKTVTVTKTGLLKNVDVICQIR
jgi:hypothetical protein